MEHEVETRIGIRIDVALNRIRSKVCLMGMAAKWHIGKASDILENPDLFRRYVEALGEHEEAKYLDQLPALIAETEERDRRCEQCWGSGLGLEEESRYQAEREDMVGLFNRFQFRPKLYERLSRQPDKPLLRNAIQFLQTGQETTPEAVAIERTVRMRLRGFILLEEDLAEDFQDLDAARETLCASYKEVALTIARGQPHTDESTLASALMGLRGAANWYDYKSGFSFEDYALEWVQKAIDQGRASPDPTP